MFKFKINAKLKQKNNIKTLMFSGQTKLASMPSGGGAVAATAAGAPAEKKGI